MAKPKRCYHCKELFKDNDEIVKFQIGVKTKVNKYAHKECREQSLKRKQFFDMLKNILDVPTIGNTKTIFTLDSFCKQGYDYEIMTHAVNEKKKQIVDNFDKGFPYIIGIIRNQLPFSYRYIKKQRENKRYIDEQIKNITYEDEKEIIYKKQVDKDDISDILC